MIASLPKQLILESNIILEATLYSRIILENRIDFLKKNNQSIDTSHDQLAIFKQPDEIIDHISNVGDPTKKKIHTQWILGQYKKKNIRQEDMYRVRDALSTFDAHKSKLDKKDINHYKTLSELETAVRPHKGTAATKSEVRQEVIDKGHTLVHDNGKGLKVFRLEPTEEGKKASQEIYGGGHELGGTHTNWCTAARSEYCMFDHYSENTPLHVIHTPTGNVYQAHPETKQLMDAKDEEFESQKENREGTKLIPHPDLKHVSDGLDHIPNGWRLKLSHDIPNIKESDLEKGISDNDDQVAMLAASHPDITDKVATIASQAHSGAVRAAVANNPKTPVHVIEKLLGDKASLVRENAIANPQLPTKKIHEVFDNADNGRIKSAAVRNPNADQELLRKGVTDESENVNYHAIKNPKSNADTLLHALKYNPKNIDAILSNRNAPPEAIDKGLEDRGWENQYTQMIAAQHKNASKENLHKALDSSVEGVRMYAAQHKNTDLSHIERGLKDTYVVQRVAARSKLLQPHHIENIINDKNMDDIAKIGAISNPKTPPHLLDKIITEYPTNTTLGHAALTHGNITTDTLQKVIDSDVDRGLLKYAAESPKLSQKQIEHLSDHESTNIRSSIAQRDDLPPNIINKLANDNHERVRNWIETKHGVKV